MGAKKLNFYPLIVIFLTAAVFFAKTVTPGKMFFTGDIDGSDITHFNLPYRNLLSHSLKSSSLPLWTKDIFCGFPVFSDGQGGFLYPPNLILFGLLPVPAAYSLSVFLTFLLAGMFMYIYARSLNLSEKGSLMAGVVFMLGGFFVTHLKQMNMINSAMWLPLMLFLIEKYFTKDKVLYIVLSGVVFAMQIFAGNPQISYCSAVFLLLYFFFGVYRKKDKKYSHMTGVRKSVVFLAVIMIIGLLLSAAQVLPMLELRGLSMRPEVSYEESTCWAYEPQDLILFLSPYFYGDPAKGTYQRGNTIFWENCIYVGLITLALAVYGIIAALKKNDYIKFFLFSTVIFLLLVMPKTVPLFRLCWYVVPFFRLFRFPHRFLLLVQFSLAVLAACGFDYAGERFFGNKKTAYRTAAEWAIVALIVLDLFKFGFKHNPAIEPERWFAKPDTVEFIENNTSSLFRTFSLGHFRTWRWAYALAGGWSGDLSPYIKQRKMLPENVNMIYGIPSFSGYTSFFTQRFSDMFGVILNGVRYTDQPVWKADISSQALKLLGLGNVKYILSMYGMDNENLIERMRTDFDPAITDIKVYENKLFLPRVFVVPACEYASERQNIFARMVSDNFNPAREVILEEKISHGSPSVEGSVVTVEVYSDKEVVISADMTGDGFLVLTDTNYPGWNACVDGRCERILNANYMYRAVPLYRGRHTVRFSYRPRSFGLGMYISLISVLMTGFAVYGLSRKKRNEYANESRRKN